MKGYITLIISLLFIVSYSQVSVVHFNSDWNNSNNYDISNLKECEKTSVVICHNPELQEKHNIKSVPTVIVFDEGLEIVRYEANLLMELTCEIKQIQKQIDKIYLAKFE